MTQTPPQPDAADFPALLSAAVEGSYGVAVRLSGNAADAEDLLQAAALNALRGRATFQVGTNFRAWFYRILVNQSFTSRRREGRMRSVGFDEESHAGIRALREVLGGPPDFDPLTRLLARMDAEEIAASLQSLPAPYDVVAILYFGQELSYREIAEMLAVPIGTVRSRLHRARMLLRKRLHRLARSAGLAAAGPRSLFAGLRLGSSCRKVLAQLGEYLDGELSPGDCQVIEGHLSACVPCQETLRLQRTFEEALRSKLGGLHCPPEVRARIMGHLMAAMGQAPIP